MRILLGVFLLALCGCNPPLEMAWQKPGASDAELRQAAYECERDTRMSAASFGGGYVGAANANDFAARCMGAKGFYYGAASISREERAKWPLIDASGKNYNPNDKVMCFLRNGVTTDMSASDCVMGYGRILSPKA